MPAKAPPSGPQIKNALIALGEQIRTKRKSLNISAIATAEAAGVSRMTLNRIEKGAPSVTLGAYLNVISVLGLKLELDDPDLPLVSKNSSLLNQNSKIQLSDYPVLKKLAWQTKKTQALSPKQALNIYERNWKHIDLSELKSKEKKLINDLKELFGMERLLV